MARQIRISKRTFKKVKKLSLKLHDRGVERTLGQIVDKFLNDLKNIKLTYTLDTHLNILLDSSIEDELCFEMTLEEFRKGPQSCK